MSFVAAVTLGLLALSALVLALAVWTAAARGARRRRERVRRAVAEPLRPLLLEVAVGEGEEAEEAAAALAHLDDGTWATVEPAVLAVLGKVRGDGQRLLVELLAARGVIARAHLELRSRSAVRRASAAELMGEAGYAPAVPELAALLHDGDAEVRLVAARALGRAGAPGALGTDGTGVVSGAPAAPAAAARALIGALGGGTGGAVTAGSAPAAPPDVVARALLLIGPPAAAALVAALHDPSPVVRLTAAEVLGRLGATAASRPLEDVVLRDAVAEVRARAATALGRLGLPSAVAPLRMATSPTGERGVRRAAAAALGEVGDPAALRCLWSLLDDADDRVADAAAASLLGLGAPGVRVLAQVAAQEAAGSPRAVERAHEVVACAVLAEVLPPAALAEVEAVLAGGLGAGRRARSAEPVGVLA